MEINLQYQQNKATPASSISNSWSSGRDDLYFLNASSICCSSITVDAENINRLPQSCTYTQAYYIELTITFQCIYWQALNLCYLFDDVFTMQVYLLSGVL